MRRLTGLLVLLLFGLSAPVGAQELAAASDTTQYLLNTALAVAAGLSAVLFILAYGLRDIGLARVQNAPAVCLRMLAAFAVTVFGFWLSGHMLAYSIEEAGFLGDFGVWTLNDNDPVAQGRAAGAAWFFQAGLAAMAAAIVAASVSERVRLWAFLIFVGFLSGLIYPIAISWVWGGGYFAESWRYRDAAGATVHIVAGAAALAAAFVVGPRPGRFNPKSPWIAATTMMPLSVFAAGLAWIALQGVVAGLAGAYADVEDAVRLGQGLANIAIATAAAVVTALMITQFVYDRPGLVTTMCAVVAGPVSLAGDPVSPGLWQAAMIGAVGGVIVSVTPPFLARFRIDDAGFVVPTHLFCGLWGALIAAWVNPELSLPGQAIGAAGVAIFSFLISLMVWTALKYSPFGARQRPAPDPSKEGAAPAPGSAPSG
jgi:Amt family ammonium transporter